MDDHADTDHQVPSQKSSCENIVDQPRDKPRVKRKSPSDLRRDKARKLKYQQKMSPLPPAPLFSDGLRLMSTSSALENRNTMPDGSFPAAPAFPDEFQLKNASDYDSRHADYISTIPRAPPFPDELRFMNASSTNSYSGCSDAVKNIPPAPPFPDELRLMSTSAPVSRVAVWNSMNSSPIYSRNKDAKCAPNRRTFAGSRPPGVSRYRTAAKRERDKKRITEYISKKKKAMEDQANANSSSNSSTPEKAGNDTTASRDDKIPQQQNQTSQTSNLQPAESARQTGQHDNKRQSHSAYEASSSESLQTAPGDKHEVKPKDYQHMYTHRDEPGSANADGQQYEHKERRSDPYRWYRDTPAQKTVRTNYRHGHHYNNSAHGDDSFHRYNPQEHSAQRPAFSGRDCARDAKWDREYYLAMAGFARRDYYMAKFAGNHERAEVAWRDYCSARRFCDFESADAASEDCYLLF